MESLLFCNQFVFGNRELIFDTGSKVGEMKRTLFIPIVGV